MENARERLVSELLALANRLIHLGGLEAQEQAVQRMQQDHADTLQKEIDERERMRQSYDKEIAVIKASMAELENQLRDAVNGQRGHEDMQTRCHFYEEQLKEAHRSAKEAKDRYDEQLKEARNQFRRELHAKELDVEKLASGRALQLLQQDADKREQAFQKDAEKREQLVRENEVLKLKNEQMAERLQELERTSVSATMGSREKGDRHEDNILQQLQNVLGKTCRISKISDWHHSCDILLEWPVIDCDITPAATTATVTADQKLTNTTNDKGNNWLSILIEIKFRSGTCIAKNAILELKEFTKFRQDLETQNADGGVLFSSGRVHANMLMYRENNQMYVGGGDFGDLIRGLISLLVDLLARRQTSQIKPLPFPGKTEVRTLVSNLCDLYQESRSTIQQMTTIATVYRNRTGDAKFKSVMQALEEVKSRCPDVIAANLEEVLQKGKHRKPLPKVPKAHGESKSTQRIDQSVAASAPKGKKLRKAVHSDEDHDTTDTVPPYKKVKRTHEIQAQLTFSGFTSGAL
jgi:hypothetical protein